MKKNVEIECIKEMKRDIINGYGYREIEYSFGSDTILLKLDNDNVNIITVIKSLIYYAAPISVF